MSKKYSLIIEDSGGEKIKANSLEELIRKIYEYPEIFWELDEDRQGLDLLEIKENGVYVGEGSKLLDFKSQTITITINFRKSGAKFFAVFPMQER